MTSIVCHMGARLDAPENTVPSAEIAAQKGGAILELDIRQSRDGVLYVIHDATVDRTTDGAGAVAEMNSAEIDALDAGAWFAPEFAGVRVPRLQDYLAQFKDRMGFYLELKWCDPQAVAQLVDRLEIAGQCFTSSFEAEMRAGMRKYAPEVRQMVHWNIPQNAERARDEHGAAIVEFFASNFAEDDVRDAQAAGLDVMVFEDQPNVDLFRRALGLNLTYVNIDHIDLFRDMRDG